MSQDIEKKAVSYFNEGFLCSQAILLAFGNKVGIDEETAIRIARPFGSGMARMCGTCGAVTGAYMVLGLLCQNQNEKAAKENCYELCRVFAKEFQEKNGSTNCQQLLQCDLGTTEGQNKFRQDNLVRQCQTYVNCSAEILDSMLL